MFEKHTNGQMAFNTQPAITQRDIQRTSPDLPQERKVAQRHACKSQTVKALNSRAGLSTPLLIMGQGLPPL